MDTTEHDLKLLSIGYYIQAGIAGFYSLFVLAYASFLGTIFRVVSRKLEEKGQQGIPPVFVSLAATVIGIVLILVIVYTLCLFLAGQWIVRHRNRLFIYVIGAITCLAIPYGTVLGIFTFMVMQRPTAQMLFGGSPVRQPVPPPIPG